MKLARRTAAYQDAAVAAFSDGATRADVAEFEAHCAALGDDEYQLTEALRFLVAALRSVPGPADEVAVVVVQT
ncbi:hypothetical protein [Geminicoccus harenae]|nr:hypothetical protein [Geminicoccus harenae]